MSLYVIFNNLASFITDIKLLYIPVNYGKLMFLTNVKATRYTDCYACFVAVSDDITSKTDHARFLPK